MRVYLDARATAAALDVQLPGLDSVLARLRAEIDPGRPHPLEAIAT